MKIIKHKYIVYLLFISSLFYIACKSSKENQVVTPKPTPVKLVPVEQVQVAIPIHTSGRLYPASQAALSFKTGGIIAGLYTDEGQTVKKGQMLARLDLSEIQARVRQAESAYQKALRDKKRVQNLYNDRAATLEQMQDVETALDVAQSNQTIARFNLRHSKIVAPSNGKILKRLKEENEIVSAGHPVYIFASTQSKWKVKVGVNLKDLIKLELQDRGEVTFDAYPGQTFEAVVTEVSEAVDPASGTCEVELELSKESPLKLISGFIAAVDIYPSGKKTYYRVPVDALVDAEGRDGFVFTEEKGQAKKVAVIIAHLQGDVALILPTQEPLTRVVTHGAPYLSHGAPLVTVRQ